MGRMKDADDFGNRMKAYEAVETGRRLDVTMPIYARIDGRAFSSFTRGMDRPFDFRMLSAMVATASHLVGTALSSLSPGRRRSRCKDKAMPQSITPKRVTPASRRSTRWHAPEHSAGTRRIAICGDA